MRRLIFTRIKCALFVLMGVGSLQGQTIFGETIKVPSGFIANEVVMPPSPLTMQVLFVGGHDIVESTKTYNSPAGRAIAKEWHDFIGFTPDKGTNDLGWVSINHEMIYQDDRLGDGGGMTVFKVKRTANGGLEVVDQKLQDGRAGKYFNIDFVNTVGETGMNCGGIISPNGRIWTAEEWFRSRNTDIFTGNTSTSSLPIRVANVTTGYGVRDTADWTVKSDIPGWNGLKLPKFQNFNWMVEVDPKEAKAIRKQYNWGRAGWEGGAISTDLKTVYLGNDESPSAFFKFVADVADDYNAGKMYFLKHDAVGSKWLEVPNTISTLKDSLNAYAVSKGATLFLRNEWVTIDPNSGIVYWSETGNDNGGRFFVSGTAAGGVVHPFHNKLAAEQNLPSAVNNSYLDPYGRVWYYDPKTSDLGVAITGGPWFATSPAEANYPEVHLSNPDGLSTMQIGGKSFLVICEDLNGTSYGRTPAGVNNTTCELFLLDVRKAKEAKQSDLIRISAVPRGAEVTGAVVTPDGKSLLVNCQHPNINNPFPYNHSLTYAINGFEKVVLTGLQNPSEDELKKFKVFPNPTTREIFLDETTDFAIYNIEGKLIKTYQNVNSAYVGDFSPATYFIKTKKGDTYKFVVQ